VPLPVNLKYLNIFEKDEEVTLDSLKSKGILAKDLPGETRVKILGDGEIGVPLSVFLPTSKKAREKIEKAGGKVIVPAKTLEEKPPAKGKKDGKKVTKKRTKLSEGK